jgi:hypothetical protein
LQYVMVPSVRMFYPDGIIHFRQDYSSIHDSRVVKVWLSMKADVELIEWPQRASDMNPIENTWREMKRTMNGTSPVLPPRNSDELRTLVSNAWDEVASSHALRSIINWVNDTMNEISGRSKGVLDFWLKRLVSEISPFKG